VDVPTTQRKLEGKYSLESTDPRESEIRAPPQLELGLYRFLSRYRISFFLVGFSKVGIGFGFSKYRDIGFSFRFFRTNLPLLIE